MRHSEIGHSPIERLEPRCLLSAVPAPIADLAVDEVLDFTTGGKTSTNANGTVFFSVPSRQRDSADLWKLAPDGQQTLITSFRGSFSPTEPLIANLSPGAGASAFFTAASASTPSSAEFWYTDGTALGTRNLFPFNGPIFVGSNARIPFVRLGTNTYFNAGGLQRVSDSPGGPAAVSGAGSATALTVANGALYFLDPSSAAPGLYRVNDAGTSATRVVAVNSALSMANVNGTLYFAAYESGSGAYRLYKSDGTTAGTQALGLFGGSVSSPPQLVGVGDTVYFAASSAAAGLELWKSDGTAAGTAQVIDLNAGTSSSTPLNLTAYDGHLYFSAASAPSAGRYLYSTDGTAGGTELVTPLDRTAFTGITETKVVNGTLYFAARTTAEGYELWRTYAGGTGLVSDRYPGRGSSRPHELLEVGGALYYQGVDPALGYGLFKTDGTAAGTAVVHDYLPGAPDLRFVNPFFATTADGRMFYSDGDQTATGRELYVTDGTAGGTRLVKDLLSGSSGSSPGYLATVGNTVYFAAEGSFTQGVELWKSDGTAAGTVLVKNIHSDDRLLYSTFSSEPRNLINVNGTLYFSADDGVHGRELWKSDGTDGGTVMYDLSTASGGSFPQNMIAVGSTLFFTVEGSGFTALWKIAPGDAAPVALKSFKETPNVGNFGIQSLTAVNGTLYFAGDDGTNGMELWKSNGTAAGTVMVKDIRTVPDQQNQRSSRPGGFMAAGGYVVFYADDGVTGRELWRTDGTAAGTVLLKDIYPNKFSDSTSNGSNPFPSAALDGWVYFPAADGVHGTELWRTDGTPAGTAMVKDVNPGAASSAPTWFGVAGGRLYFTADDGATGVELWTTDGTDAGTVRVADLNPGPASSNPARLQSLNGALMFMAGDGVNGPSLFRFEPEGVKPTVMGAQFTRVGGKPAVVVDFDEDVSGSLAAADLMVTNLTTGQALDPAAFAVAWDAVNNRATFMLGGAVLADGNYRVNLAANGVRDTSDNPLAADGTLDFFVLAGDANGDRAVNFADLLALAKNYGRSGVGLAEGDFNGDGVVNFADLLALAKNYNKTLEVPPPPPPPPAPAPVISAATVASKGSKRQVAGAKPLFSTRPVVVRPAPVKKSVLKG